MGRSQRIGVGPGFWVVTRESLFERAVRGWIPGKFLQKCPLCPLYPPPLTTIRNETFFRVDVGWHCWQAAKGWLCLTDAQRYYTTLQFWQVTGSADGVYPGYLARFSPYLVSYAGCGRDARDFEDFLRRGFHCQRQYKKPSNPGGYAIISDAPVSSCLQIREFSLL